MIFEFKQLGQLGRAGNGLFQVAATIGTALKYGAHYSFPEWKYQNEFNLPQNAFGNFSTQDLGQTYREPYFHYKEIVPQEHDHKVDLVGYFQSPKYWSGFEKEIKELLTPKNLPNRHVGKTGIHVRRGDYLQFQDCHPTCSLEYYKEAINKVPSKQFIVFSDDISWCKENFIGSEFEFSEGKNEIDDLKHLIVCDHQIIANSSFSWWGAYLNDNPAQIVISPKNWFGLKLNHDTKDLVPSDWIKI